MVVNKDDDPGSLPENNEKRKCDYECLPKAPGVFLSAVEAAVVMALAAVRTALLMVGDAEAAIFATSCNTADGLNKDSLMGSFEPGSFSAGSFKSFEGADVSLISEGSFAGVAEHSFNGEGDGERELVFRVAVESFEVLAEPSC